MENYESQHTRLIFGLEVTSALGRMLRHIVAIVPHSQDREMPEIRKKPDLRTFRNTSMFKEIKQLTGLSPNNRRPSERWSLHRGLFKRENSLLGGVSGCFSPNQHRRIANLFTPNEKDHRLVSIESKIFVCKFNKDGSKLITGSQDAIVRVFDSSKGTYHRINRIKAKDVGWSILDIDFSPCGQYFAYSTWSDFFFIVRLNNSSEGFQWLDLRSQRNRSGVFSIRFSPQGDTLIGGCNDSCIYMFDLETRTPQKIRTLLHNYVDINAISYVNDQSPDMIVSGCNHGIIKLWDRRCLGNNNSIPVGTFYGHMDGITYIDPRNDGNFILSNSKDQSIKIWDLRKPTPSGVTTDGIRLPMAEWDYRWDNVPRDYYNPPISLAGDVSVMTYRGHRVTKSLLRAKFSPAVQTGQRYIYTGCGTGRIIVYDVLTGHIKDAIEGHKDIVRDLSWHPVRSEIVSSSWDKHVNLNTFKRNHLMKSRIPEVSKRKTPLRRSRRIANRKRELDDDDEDDDI